MSAAAELARQQALLTAIRSAGSPGLPVAAVALRGYGAGQPADRAAGLRAYRANAQAIAERALCAAYPVLTQLVGEETMAALARDLWREHPPTRGDLAWFGAELPGQLTATLELAEVPYLADVARLEWAVHRAHTAADPPDGAPDLQALASGDAEALGVRFVDGSACITSAWPVLTIWRVHQAPAGNEPDLGPAREALAAGQGEVAWIGRRGHRVDVVALTPAECAFNQELLAGRALGPALARVSARHPEFSFEHWLLRALREGWLAGLQPLNPKT
jgi:hypothetical protein